MVRLARARVPGAVDIRRASLSEPLGWLDDESQDVAVMALVLHPLDEPSNDGLASAGRSYFGVETVEETWQDDWTVRWLRQPLERWCAEFADAGFVIERLVEPQPVAAMERVDPDVYRKLLNEPGFIVFQLAKSRVVPVFSGGA